MSVSLFKREVFVAHFPHLVDAMEALRCSGNDSVIRRSSDGALLAFIGGYNKRKHEKN